MNTKTLKDMVEVPANMESIPFCITSKDDSGEMHIYAYHHASLTNGYVKKKATCVPIPYKGRFGKGYTVNIHNSNSTRYAYKVYYLEITRKIVCDANDNCTLCPLYSSENGEHCFY